MIKILHEKINLTKQREFKLDGRPKKLTKYYKVYHRKSQDKYFHSFAYEEVENSLEKKNNLFQSSKNQNSPFSPKDKLQRESSKMPKYSPSTKKTFSKLSNPIPASN